MQRKHKLKTSIFLFRVPQVSRRTSTTGTFRLLCGCVSSAMTAFLHRRDSSHSSWAPCGTAVTRDTTSRLCQVYPCLKWPERLVGLCHFFFTSKWVYRCNNLNHNFLPFMFVSGLLMSKVAKKVWLFVSFIYYKVSLETLLFKSQLLGFKCKKANMNLLYARTK